MRRDLLAAKRQHYEGTLEKDEAVRQSKNLSEELRVAKELADGLKSQLSSLQTYVGQAS